jgi:hypothetical protein
MDERADPRLVLIAAVLMAAVTIIYVADRAMNPNHYPQSLSPAAILHAPLSPS